MLPIFKKLDVESRSRSPIPPELDVVFSSSIVPEVLPDLDEPDEPDDEGSCDSCLPPSRSATPSEEDDEEEALHREDFLFFKLDEGFEGFLFSLALRARARWSRAAWRDRAGADARVSFSTLLLLSEARMRRVAESPRPDCWPAARVNEAVATEARAASSEDARMVIRARVYCVQC